MFIFELIYFEWCNREKELVQITKEFPEEKKMAEFINKKNDGRKMIVVTQAYRHASSKNASIRLINYID